MTQENPGVIRQAIRGVFGAFSVTTETVLTVCAVVSLIISFGLMPLNMLGSKLISGPDPEGQKQQSFMGRFISAPLKAPAGYMMLLALFFFDLMEKSPVIHNAYDAFRTQGAFLGMDLPEKRPLDFTKLRKAGETVVQIAADGSHMVMNRVKPAVKQEKAKQGKAEREKALSPVDHDKVVMSYNRLSNDNRGAEGASSSTTVEGVDPALFSGK
jgi:hypothetical protein